MELHKSQSACKWRKYASFPKEYLSKDKLECCSGDRRYCTTDSKSIGMYGRGSEIAVVVKLILTVQAYEEKRYVVSLNRSKRVLPPSKLAIVSVSRG